MNPSDLSMPEREVAGGLERASFSLPASFFLSNAGKHPDIMKRMIAGVYCASPRPDPREIQDISVRFDGKAAYVTLIIQRGHYNLARLIMEHDEVTFRRSDGYATCSCHPGTRHPIVESSIPDYGKEL